MTSIDIRLRALAKTAAADISAPEGLSSLVLGRVARARRRRRVAGFSAVAVLALGASVGATRLGAGPYFNEIQPSGAMAPTVAVGEKVTFNRDIAAVPGDVVRLQLPTIKVPSLSRVIAGGGHTVGCPAEPDGACAGVQVDGHVLRDPYLASLATAPFRDIVVRSGEVFVLGDNRDAALDSRVLGPIATGDIKAVAVAITRDNRVVAIPGAPRHDVPGDGDVIDPPDPLPRSRTSGAT